MVHEDTIYVVFSAEAAKYTDVRTRTRTFTLQLVRNSLIGNISFSDEPNSLNIDTMSIIGSVPFLCFLRRVTTNQL